MYITQRSDFCISKTLEKCLCPPFSLVLVFSGVLVTSLFGYFESGEYQNK